MFGERAQANLADRDDDVARTPRGTVEVWEVNAAGDGAAARTETVR